MASSTLLHVSNGIPFAPAFHCWLELNRSPLDALVTQSRRYEQPYLAWELVRKAKNPFFDDGTGFEGYFIGLCQTTDEVLARLLQMGQQVLGSISREFRREYGFKSRLMKTLAGERCDPKAVDIWDAELGATIARLRCNLQNNRKGDMFRIETYRLTRSLPPVRYWENDGEIHQEYWLGYHKPNPKPHVDINGLKGSEQDAWLVALSIGRFGHPLLRSYLGYFRQHLFRYCLPET